MEAGLAAHAAGALVLSQKYEAQKALMAREGKERGGVALEEARQWPRRSLHLQVGEREGREDVAFLEAAELARALVPFASLKNGRVETLLLPPEDPGCDDLMESPDPGAAARQPGEPEGPKGDAPMKAPGPEPGGENPTKRPRGLDV
ncbi:hypothetical protein DIPPA_01252 [Diplonema papillatum]|nr:hypothetical protein DIPPA_01252 [Diplonema papillatum]